MGEVTENIEGSAMGREAQEKDLCRGESMKG